MEQYLTGFFALGGALIGGLVTYAVQARAQSSLDARHRQQLAYEVASRAWEFWSRCKMEEVRTSGGKVAMPHLNYFLACHIRLSEFLNGRDIIKMSDAALARELNKLAERDKALAELLGEELLRGTQKTQVGPK